MGGGGSSSSRSQVQWFPGQQAAILDSGIFARGGLFDQILAGKPSVGAERAQAGGLELLARQQASAGMTGQPLAMRQQADYLAKSTQAREQDFLQTLQSFMQPAGQTSKSSSVNASILGSG